MYCTPQQTAIGRPWNAQSASAEPLLKATSSIYWTSSKNRGNSLRFVLLADVIRTSICTKWTFNQRLMDVQLSTGITLKLPTKMVITRSDLLFNLISKTSYKLFLKILNVLKYLSLLHVWAATIPPRHLSSPKGYESMDRFFTNIEVQQTKKTSIFECLIKVLSHQTQLSNALRFYFKR